MMATIVRMPEVLAGSTEAALQAWLVGVGDTVAIGQPLAEIETEKAMVEYASEIEGVLVSLLVEPGASVAVGTPIGVIAAAGEEVDVSSLLAGDGGGSGIAAAPAPPEPETAPETAPAAPVPPAPAPPSAPVPPPTPVSPPAPGTRQFASPLVRRIANERGLDLSTVSGSGPGGRIVRRDIEVLPAQPGSAAAPAPVPAEPAPIHAAPAGSSAADVPQVGAVPAVATSGYTDVPHTGMRRAIARRLTESKSTVPHFYLTAHCRVDALLELRKSVNETSPRKISVNDFVVKAVAAAFVDVPEANAIWTDQATRRFDAVDLAIAVSTDGGLLTPVLRGVDSMSLSSVSAAIADLAERARAGRLKQQELDGGSFAISNLGMYGVDEFSAILNPPQSGILAVGAAKPRPVVDGTTLTVGTVMTVTLSADHRVVDGALAARWLAAFVAKIEHPLGILL
ncbi:MAG: pyruvate dehydrogenase complex dihydrolipoamide acetyltransferase [Microbacteriaceae bacterium]|nr:pyruvate dehydrogenase complex dihydrolipoamide acetyltransferase [Microbacteriaceae bacterium]